MPKITSDFIEAEVWNRALIQQYETEKARTGVHVSDLILCLRQPALLARYVPKWNITALLRITLGRALEVAFFKLVLPFTTQEVEVIEEGIEAVSYTHMTLPTIYSV